MQQVKHFLWTRERQVQPPVVQQCLQPAWSKSQCNGPGPICQIEVNIATNHFHIHSKKSIKNSCSSTGGTMQLLQFTCLSFRLSSASLRIHKTILPCSYLSEGQGNSLSDVSGRHADIGNNGHGAELQFCTRETPRS